MAPPLELARLMAYAFQATGRRRLLEEDIVRLVAHERRWLSPSRVRALVQLARDGGVLRAAGAHAFEFSDEYGGLTLPIDYRPDLAILESGVVAAAPVTDLPLFRQVVRFISEGTQRSEPEVVSAINSYQEEVGGLLRAEVAALVVGRLYDLDVSRFYDAAEAHLRHGHAKGAK